MSMPSSAPASASAPMISGGGGSGATSSSAASSPINAGGAGHQGYGSSSSTGVDVALTVNPANGAGVNDEDEVDLDPPPPPITSFSGPTSFTGPSSLMLNTAERRASATQMQNEAAWRAIQDNAEKDDDDLADIIPLFPTTVTSKMQLRPSSAPRASLLLAKQSNAAAPAHGLIHRPSGASSSSSSSSSSSGAVEHETASHADWEASTLAASKNRAAAASQSFMTVSEQQQLLQLPPAFKGAKGLVMPAYLTGPISNVTLPSRLDLLGRRGFKILGAFMPRRVGNSVLCWSPVLTTSWTNKEWRVKMQLFHLPRIFSKSMAKILLFLRFVFVALFVILTLDISGAVDANPGRVWAVGVFLAFCVLWQQSEYRRCPDGVMAFCRSMAVPDVEEYMFSYCWKVEPDNVRTLAKAVWKAGVGVWIDVVKLCPGDEIRPMVRTTVKRVHKVVVFLCQEYCDSVNCCVEMMEAVQWPEKVTICVIKDNVDPSILDFLLALQPRGLRMCHGFDELMQLLNTDLQDMTDIAAFQWWRSQTVSGAGVPSSLVPTSWPMARFSITGKMILPEKSVDVGPLYISGDCKTTGKSLALPWLLVVALMAVAINAYDFYTKYQDSAFLHTTIDYIFLGVIAGCTCAPFLGFSYLLDRRRDAHVSLRPLLASRSMGKDGIKVRIIGHEDDPIYVALRAFLTNLGHLAPDLPYGDLSAAASSSNLLAAGVLHSASGSLSGGQGGAPSNRQPRAVTVYVMESIARRNELFGADMRKKGQFDNRFSLFVWSGAKEAPGVIPFTDDEIGQRLMRFLVLVANWEKHGLCESLFSAIGVRVVDILHEKPSKKNPASASGTPAMRHGSVATNGSSYGKVYAVQEE